MNSNSSITLLQLLLVVCASTSAFVIPPSSIHLPIMTRASSSSNSPLQMASTVEEEKEVKIFDQEQYIQQSKDMRLQHLEEQAMYALRIAVENYGNAVFPNAMIAGDIVITDLLHRMGYLQDGRAKIMVVDTFHLFPETMEFLKVLEKKYEFEAEIFCADGIPVGDKEAFDKRYGANLWREDIDEYDRVCKVEPFQRGLKTLKTDCMINGRTRWQGFERAWINLFENAPIGGGMAKCNPIAYWTLEDVFDYFSKYKIPYHPLHEKGYPSIGDAKDTIPIPEDGSVAFVNYEWVGDKTKWLDYARERVGRFVGLANKDGSVKTECGIHVDGAERTWERDLWVENESSAIKLHTVEEALATKQAGEPSLLVVYAPWCPFSQKMEEEYEALAAKMSQDANNKIKVYTFRGDEEREFVMENFNTNSFPTINV
jgi:phosphoadenylyl-sulfate reductase (thioredoxin)